MATDMGKALPKFGEWDVNDPATAEGFTVIFNKARDEKKTTATGKGSSAKLPNDQNYSYPTSKVFIHGWIRESRGFAVLSVSIVISIAALFFLVY